MNRISKYLPILLAATMLHGVLQAQRFNVGTYNLRFAGAQDSAKGNGWGQRDPVLANLVKFHQFDLFGTQEGLYAQLESLKDSLPGYTYIGVGRDDGKKKGEFSAIFYNTGKFRLLNSGSFWLSTVTDKPNKGWDAALPRICTWGQFEEKATGFTFLFYNLHMDHIGVQARAESAKLIFEKIKAMPAETPAILTGDFNIDQHNEGYALINQSGILRDAYELAPIKLANTGTFNNFDADSFSDSRIDHIFVSKHFKVLRYGILTDTYHTSDATKQKNTTRTPSDHYPVLIEVETAKGKRSGK